MFAAQFGEDARCNHIRCKCRMKRTTTTRRGGEDLTDAVSGVTNEDVVVVVMSWVGEGAVSEAKS